MRVCYWGSGNFSKMVLEGILELGGGKSVELVVTKSDKEKGRGKNISQTPVKELALSVGIDVCDREDIRSQDFVDYIAPKNFDLFIVCDYGKIIPRSVFSLPRLGSLGVHPSLLPKYRGPSPIHASILNGDEKTGTTLFVINEEMDAGDIVLQKEIVISDDDYISLSRKLAHLSAQCVVEFMASPHSFTPHPQDYMQATFTKMITKEDGRINWSDSAIDIVRKVRAYIIWPKAWFTFRNKNVKILKAEVCNDFKIIGNVGEIVKIDGNGIYVLTGSGVIILKELHPENSNVMGARDFVNGYRVKVGDTFM